MNFLNPLLVFGAAAFAIPLVIHLLNRSRYRTIEWGAMHLLESVIKVNHRRFQFDQLILLLVRCAIPVLLAICLARPVLTGAKALAGNAPVSLVILLDTSSSMDTVDTAGSRFARAVDAACDIVIAAGRGSEISVILTGGQPTPLFDQPILDSTAVTRRLKQQRGGLGAGDMSAALDAALATLAGMSHARRELVVISDFQPTDWTPLEATIAASIRRQVAALPAQPELTLLPVGHSVSTNLSVDALEFPQRALGVGQRLDVRALIHNHGASPIDRVRVVLRMDGIETEVSQVAVPPRGSTHALLQCTFETAGSHTVEVEVNSNDPLASDNRFAAAVTVWDTIKVLLVDGDPSGQPLQGETDFLAVALTPHAFGRTRLTDLVETQTVAPAEISGDLLQSARVVVLANVARLDESQLAALTAYVEEGGALLVTAGNRIDLDWYREQMFAAGNGLLPASYGPPQGQVDDAGRSARIVAQHFDHPALEFFNTRKNGDLSQAEIRRWYLLAELPPAGIDTSRRGPQPVLARLDTGAPLLLERRYGDGVVLQLATACDADWSDLPMRPFYVPLMQQLITTMASQLTPPRNIAAGEPAAALLSGLEPESTLSVLSPDGLRHTLQSTTQGKLQVARFLNTQRPGIYAMSLPTTETIHFVAESSREESKLELLEEPQLAALAEKLGADVVATSGQYVEQDQLRRHGREVWKYLLSGLLALMFLELVLQQRFSGVRG